MNGEKAISVDSGKIAMLLPRSISVLIVDGDSTCLVILSKMLHWFGYEGISFEFYCFSLLYHFSHQNL